MYSDNTMDNNQKLLKQWNEQCKKRYGNQEFNATTASGIPLKPFYSPQDIQDMSWEDIGVPGEYPYTRGNFPLEYQFKSWDNAQPQGYGLPEHARQRFDFLRKEGLGGYFGGGAFWLLELDQPSQCGYDPDHPVARGSVGRCGIPGSTLEDYDLLFHDLPIDKMFVEVHDAEACLPGLALYIVYAESRGIPQANLAGQSSNWIYRQAMCHDNPTFATEHVLKLMTELIRHCTRNMPRWKTISINTHGWGEMGANAFQRIAFGMALHTALVEECKRAGLKPDDFIPRFIASGWPGRDFFENIAELRAFRRLWAKINHERFGCQNPHSLQLRYFTGGSGSVLTAQEPLNNIIRLTLQTLSSILGGASSLYTPSYDEPLGLPTEEAALIALRTQQILYNETNIPKVSDPLGGSCYVEWLTHQLEVEATKLLEQIESVGFLKCWQNGFFKQECERNVYEWGQKLERGEQIVVGVNKFASGQKPQIRAFKVDPSVETIAIERVQRYKAQRDQTRFQSAMENLRQVANGVKDKWPDSPELMPALINAVKAHATKGEMMDVLRGVFGWGYAH